MSLWWLLLIVPASMWVGVVVLIFWFAHAWSRRS